MEKPSFETGLAIMYAMSTLGTLCVLELTLGFGNVDLVRFLGSTVTGLGIVTLIVYIHYDAVKEWLGYKKEQTTFNNKE